MTREEMVALIERRGRAWKERNPAAFVADFAEDAIVDSPTAGTAAGRVSIKALFRNWTSAFPDLEWTREDAVIDGNRAAVSFKLAGTHRGPFLGLAPTNRRFEIRGITLITVRDGKIVYERRIYDFTGFLVQLGLIKPFAE